MLEHESFTNPSYFDENENYEIDNFLFDDYYDYLDSMQETELKYEKMYN